MNSPQNSSSSLFINDLSVLLNGTIESLDCYENKLKTCVDAYTNHKNCSWVNDLYFIDMIVDYTMNTFIHTGIKEILQSQVLFDSLSERVDHINRSHWQHEIFFGYRYCGNDQDNKLRTEEMTNFVIMLGGIGIKPIDLLLDYHLDPVLASFRDL